MVLASFIVAITVIVIGLIGTKRSTGFDDIAWLILMIYPGAIGLGIAVIGLIFAIIPAVSVVAPWIAGIACLASLSMILYATGAWLIDWVTGK